MLGESGEANTSVHGPGGFHACTRFYTGFTTVFLMLIISPKQDEILCLPLISAETVNKLLAIFEPLLHCLRYQMGEMTLTLQVDDYEVHMKLF